MHRSLPQRIYVGATTVNGEKRFFEYSIHECEHVPKCILKHEALPDGVVPLQADEDTTENAIWLKQINENL